MKEGFGQEAIMNMQRAKKAMNNERCMFAVVNSDEVEEKQLRDRP